MWKKTYRVFVAFAILAVLVAVGIARKTHYNFGIFTIDKAAKKSRVAPLL